MTRRSSVGGSLSDGGADLPHLRLLVDTQANRDAPHLEQLLPFGSVDRIEVAQLVELSEGENDQWLTLRSREGDFRCSVPPLDQFRRIARRMVEESDAAAQEAELTRAMALAYLCERREADAVVSPIRHAFGDESGLLSDQRMWTVKEALAVIGANVRLRPLVPLAGAPMLHIDRPRAYTRTVVGLIPSYSTWATGCRAGLPAASSGQSLEQTVLTRVAQALRGRDAVHEGVRCLQGGLAVEEALYHFDVVLTSTVASFDALSRLMDELFRLALRRDQCGLQKKGFRKVLRRTGGQTRLAEMLQKDQRVGQRISVITTLRNQIHGVAPAEVLYVRGVSGLVEHRITLPQGLTEELRVAMAGMEEEAETCGLFLEEVPPSVNVAMFVEAVMLWTLEILNELMAGMLESDRLAGPLETPSSSLLPGMDDRLLLLAQVGTYPTTPGVGIAPTPGARREMLRTRARALRG